jgi:WD40 repeat protein
VNDSSRVEEIFLAAVERDPSEWPAFLESQCGGDQALRTEIESLLDCHRGNDDFLDSKDAPGRGLLTEIGATAIAEDEPILPADRRIGRYHVLGRIGMGGMGVVYVAEQDRPKRTVALKVMRGVMASNRILRRFEYEAEVLGRLQHPGIAQIYEAGVWEHLGTKRPYIAMELIRGLPISSFVKARHTSIREILALIADVCDAIQHAHQSGVIHRDIKPGNILVDEEGRPRILDFGVARPASNDLQLTTTFTGLGQIVGTLPYMSPEQVRGAEGIDTRTDVYALGVVLFELLCGRLPHQVRDLSLIDAARLITDTDPPRPGSLDRRLRGEIETILLKALEKAPERRYQSAAALADDLRRYLDGRPIEAQQDSAFYVLRKQIRRHKAWATAAAVASITLVGFAVFAGWQARVQGRLATSERNARETAVLAATTAADQRTKATEAAARLERELETSTVERAKLLAQVGSLALAEDTLWRAFTKRPDSTHARWALWDLYKRLPALAGATIPSGMSGGMEVLSGQRVILGSGDGPIWVWDGPDLAHRRQIADFETTIFAFDVSPDETLVAAGGRNSEIAIYDLATGILVRRIESPSPVRGLRFRDDSRSLLAATEDGRVRTYLTDSGAMTSDWMIHPNAIYRLEVARDGSRFAVLGHDAVTVFDPTGRVISYSDVGGTGLSAMTFSPDGSMILAGGRDRVLRVHNADTGSLIRDIPLSNGTIRSIGYAPDGKSIAVGGWWRIDFLNAATWQKERSFAASAAIVVASYSNDGSLLFSSSDNGDIRCWELKTRETTRLSGHEGAVCGAFAPDARSFATGDLAGTLRLWSTADSTQPTRQIAAHKGRVRCVRFHPTRPLIASGGRDGTIRVFDLATGAIVREFPDYNDSTVQSIDFSPDGTRIAYTRTDRTTVVRQLDGPGELVFQADTAEPLAIAFSADGTRFARFGRDNIVFLHNLQTGTEIARHAMGDTPGWTLTFTPDGSRLIVTTWRRRAVLLDGRSLEPRGTLDGHSGLLSSASVSPALPDIAATCSTDGTARLWNFTDQTSLVSFDAPESADLTSVSLSPDGGSLLLCGSQGRAELIDLTYFERHMIGNLPTQLARLAADPTNQIDLTKLRAWADRLAQQQGRVPPIPGDGNR